MLHRDFVPWRFSNAGRISARLAHQRRRPKTCTNAEVGASIDHLVSPGQK
jgi:hypothetical protein